MNRPSLRQASLIIPSTGERLKKRITLRDPAFYQPPPSSDDGEHTPLLPANGSTITNNTTLAKRVLRRARRKTTAFVAFARTEEGHGIIKCSMAYLLGTLAVFLGPLSELLGRHDGKHLVANIIIWFHPARSVGSMHKATVFALLAFIFATAFSYVCMSISAFFASHGLIVLGHSFVLLFFCAGGLGFIGWIKQRFGDPLINVACSLAAVPISTVLTTEGAVQDGFFSHEAVAQILQALILAIAISTTINLAAIPVFARAQLRDGLEKTTDGLAHMLVAVAVSFLSGSQSDLDHPNVVNEASKLKVVLTHLETALEEAGYEHYVVGTEKQFLAERKLVTVLQHLSQDLGGLRSAAMLEFALIAERVPASVRKASTWVVDEDLETTTPERNHSGPYWNTLSAIEESQEPANHAQEPLQWFIPLGELSREISEPASAATPSEIFMTFITHLGPPMKSLVYTLREIFQDLSFGENHRYAIQSNPNFKPSLEEAIKLFGTSRKEALELVYKCKELSVAHSENIAADFEEVAACCGHFSSSLEDFAEHSLAYLDILDEIDEASHRRRSWKWVLSSLRWHRSVETEYNSGFRRGTRIENGVADNTPGSTPLRKPMLSPLMEMSAVQILMRRLYEKLSFFRREDIRYAIKVGVGAAMIALLSFVPPTQELYQHWRLQWALVTYMFVCSMTIGAANTTTLQRLLGTFGGAVLAVAVWILCFGNPVALASMGWLISVFCFWLILAKDQGPMGRFILLTYNLSCLYSYSLSIKDKNGDEDEGGIHPEIWEIVEHRLIAITVGCVWGIFITRMIWPIKAREKFKAGITLLWLRMGLAWKSGPLQVLLPGTEAPGRYADIRREMALRGLADSLEVIRINAESEFELRGPFPSQAFHKILQSTSNMLDAFHALNVVIAKDAKASPGETEILRYTSVEREQLARRISHLFTVLASSVKLEYSLYDAMPNIEHTRDRLLAKVYEFRKDVSTKHIATAEDFEILYVYALVTGQIAREIDEAGKEIDRLFGVVDEDMLKIY